MSNTQKSAFEYTSYYLENYLNPNKIWDKKIAPKQRIDQIRYAEVNWQTVFNHIKGMDYQNFLKTPYWKAIAAHTKYKAGYRCQLCNSASSLVTHHRSYDIHGREHEHMHELIVLCNYCHNKFHDQIPKLKPKAKQDQAPNTKPKAKKVLTILILNLTILFAFYYFFTQIRWIDTPIKLPDISIKLFDTSIKKNKRTHRRAGTSLINKLKLFFSAHK